MKAFYFSFLILLVSAIQLHAQAPEIIDIAPLSQSISNEANSDIYIHFSSGMDTESITDSTLRVFGRWSGPVSGTIEWENGDSTLHFVQEGNFMNGEYVMVSLSKDIQNTNGLAIENGYTWNYWIKTNLGSLNQIEINTIDVRLENEGNITCYGAYAGDINNDGFSDLSVVNEISQDVRLFLNDGTGNYDTFEIYDLPLGNTPSPNEGADFNNDGIIDLAIANTQNDQVSILMGDGIDGYTTEEAYTADDKVRALVVLDADSDGDDDILTANRFGNNISLLLNDGSGSFEDPIHTDSGGENETSLAVADANEDGILDAFVGAFGSEEIILMLGDGNGNFIYQTEVAVDGSPWMIGIGDVNNDGHVDVVSANSSGNKVSVILGDGNGNLEEAIDYTSAGFPIAIDLGDIDGDGDLDMMSSNYSAATYNLYENIGNGVFEDPIIYEASLAASCTILHDRDNDGDLDITGIDEVDDLIILFENDSIASSIEDVTELPSLNLSNYPNPCDEYTIVNFASSNAKRTINVFSIDWKKVQEVEIPTGVESLKLSTRSFEQGLYFYQIIEKDKILGQSTLVVAK